MIPAPCQTPSVPPRLSEDRRAPVWLPRRWRASGRRRRRSACPSRPARSLAGRSSGLGSLAINQIMPAFAKCETLEARRVRQRPSRQGRQARRALRRRSEEHLQLRELRHDQGQPRDRRRLHRAAEQHARRVHDPRAEGRQARALREADGEHAGRVRADDRRGEGGRPQADDRVPPALRAVQQRADQGRARSGVRTTARRCWPTPASPSAIRRSGA